MNTLEATDTDILASLDFDPACRSRNHDAARDGCVPGEPATYWVIAPCCGPRYMICAGRRRSLAQFDTIRCLGCRRETPTDWWRFPLIGGDR